MVNRIKIAIADDHTLVRQSFAMALETNTNFTVVGQADNGRSLIEIIEKKTPDVIILDLEMPVMNGWETLTYIRENHPQCKVVVVSMHFEGLMIKDLVANGARGFLPKNSDFETLINAIAEVADLGYFFSKKISRNIVRELLSDNAISPSFSDIKLSEKEVQVLVEICQDKLSKEIASRLNVSERTVERHKSSLYEKTRARTTAGLVLFALKNNLINLPNP